MKRAFILTVMVIGLAFIGSGTVAAQKASVAGDWDVVYNTPGGPRPFKLILKVDGEKLTGTAKRPNGDVPVEGTIKGDDIAFNYSITYGGNVLTLMFAGKVSGDTMSGTISFGGNAEDSWSAKRAAVEKPKAD